ADAAAASRSSGPGNTVSSAEVATVGELLMRGSVDGRVLVTRQGCSGAENRLGTTVNGGDDSHRG
ncbi:hypothetical protein QEN36_14475, partial [Gordonia alkanivorans]|nr:hypothetical protein [Gordonia alkanivorans]